MGRSVRTSLLFTIQVLKNAKHEMTVRDIQQRVSDLMSIFIDRRQIYANLYALLDFEYPIEVRNEKSNVKFYRWIHAENDDLSQTLFAESI